MKNDEDKKRQDQEDRNHVEQAPNRVSKQGDVSSGHTGRESRGLIKPTQATSRALSAGVQYEKAHSTEASQPLGYSIQLWLTLFYAKSRR